VTLFLGVSSIILSWRITPAAFVTLAIIGMSLAGAFVVVTRQLARQRLDPPSDPSHPRPPSKPVAPAPPGT
jgi:hypothetical protein